MAGEWVSVQLGAVTDLLTGFPFESDRYVEDVGAPRLLRGDNVAQGALRWEGTKRWPEDATGNVAAYRLREGDVVLAMDRPWIEAGLKYASVRAADLPSLLVQRVARLRGKERLDTRFLKYVIGSRSFTDYVLAVQTGTAVPHISGGQIRDFKFLLPPLPQQHAIAHILGTLDDRIELNRGMNQTLEAMARAIFKSWFVDLDPVRAKAEGRDPGLPKHLAALFPARFVDSELGDIPEGWEEKPLGHFFKVGLGGAWGEDTELVRASVAVRCLRGIDCHDLAEGRIPDVPVRWVSPKQAADRRLTDGTILIEGSGSFCGRSMIWKRAYGELLGEPIGYSNFCKRLDPFCSPTQATICWMQMREAYRDGLLQSFRTGTAFPNLDVHGILSNLIVVVPPVPLADAFGRVFGLSQRLDLMAQSRTLAALRDTLLPKLVSGELRVNDAERLVGRPV